MNELALLENKVIRQSPSLSWKDSLSIQHLLDVVSSIIAEEYIMIAKQHPDVFSEIASPPSGVRNDGR